MSRYSPSEIEAKWQEAWEKAGVFRATRTEDKPKYYVLRCSRTPRAASTWATCATTPWEM